MKSVHIDAVDLNLLRLFDAVYRTRNVSRAAEALGLTQPAASHGLTRLRLLLGDALQQLGFKQITAAGDGEQGMKIMAQNPHHLVISDFNMPKMDGLGLLQAVRSNPNTKKAAFIILTAQGDRALVQKAAALGANNVLAKPFTIEKMKAAIEAVFGALK